MNAGDFQSMRGKMAAPAAWLALAAGTACSPSAAHVGAVPPLVVGTPPMCIAQIERVEHWDAPTPLGFTALDVLAQLGGRHDSSFVWLPPPANDAYVLDYGPEHGTSHLSLSVAARDGTVLYREEVLAPHAPADTQCHVAALIIPVEVSIQSGARALDETFATELSAEAPHRAELNYQWRSGYSPGAFDFTELSSLDPRWTYARGSILLRAQLWPGGSRGSLRSELWASETKEVRRRRGRATAAWPSPELAELAVWPSAEQCDAPSQALPSAARLLGFSAVDVLAVLGRSAIHELTWEDGSRAVLEFSFEPLASELCQSSDQELSFDAQLRARTRDGRLDSAVAVRIRASPSGNAIGEVFVHSLEDAGAPLELEASFRDELSQGSLVLATQGQTPSAAGLLRGNWQR